MAAIQTTSQNDSIQQQARMTQFNNKPTSFYALSSHFHDGRRPSTFMVTVDRFHLKIHKHKIPKAKIPKIKTNAQLNN